MSEDFDDRMVALLEQYQAKLTETGNWLRNEVRKLLDEEGKKVVHEVVATAVEKLQEGSE